MLIRQLTDSLSTIYNNLFTSNSVSHNPITGVGSTDDPGASATVSASRQNNISDQLAATLYLENRIIQKIVDLIPEAAGYAEVTISGEVDTDLANDIKQQIQDLKVIQLFVQASISARLFRESYILIDNGDLNLDQPINSDQSNPIINLELFEFGQLRPIYNLNYTQRLGYSLVFEIDKEAALDPALESANSYVETVTTTADVGRFIHPSRILLFTGKRLSYKLQSANNYYHAGILSGVLSSFLQLKQGYAISSSLLSRMVTFVYKMSNLAERVASGDDYQIEKRLKLHKKGIGSVGGLIIDKESEDVDWLTINLAGVQSIVQELKDIFTAETDLSHDQLWNEGSNDTASLIEDKNQRKKINNFISTNWQENFNTLAKLLYTVDDDSDKDVTFTLAIKDDEDLSSIVADRQVQTTSDIAYINAGVLAASEVRDNRFVSGYSFDTTVTGDIPEPKPDEQNTNQNQISSTPNNNNKQNSKQSTVKDASYKSISDYKLTQADVQAALVQVSKDNPILYALLIAEEDPETKK